MKRMDNSEGCDILRKAGFSAGEIAQLSQLRGAYTEQEIHRVFVTCHLPKGEGWFERVVRKIPRLCRHLADAGGVFWTQDHVL